MRVALLLAICATTAFSEVCPDDHDASSLLQVQDSFAPELSAASDGSALLGDGDYGVEVADSSALTPPVELAESAGAQDIPALGGKASLTKSVVNFKLWRVNDGLLRTFRSVNGSGFHLYGTKAWRTGRRAQATLFKAHGEKMGVISMGKVDALLRMPRELVAGEHAQREKLMPVKYHVQSFAQVCMTQKPNGREPGTGAALYEFARVSKAAIQDTWTVERMVCDGATASNKAHYKLAYTLAHHGDETSFEAVHPLAGVVGTVDADKKATVKGADWSYARRVNAWLTKGEDPALFSAAVMITQMPASPVVA